MMKKMNSLLCAVLCLVLVSSCFEDNDDDLTTTTNINDFIWKAMNATYLYKSEIPDLANDRFGSDEEYTNYLNSFSSPESIFNSLRFLPETVDKFSVLFSNYFDVLNAQQGTTVTKGFEFNLYIVPGTENEVFGAVTLVLDGGAASNAGLQRGMLFRSVDGTPLTRSNLSSLLGQTSYTLNFADYDTNGTTETTGDDSISLNGMSLNLTSTTFTENPIHIAETLTVDGINIGYLMYNSFNNNFEADLNEAFAQFAAASVTELVVDLRYNGGGSVQTSANLASMITGQFTGSVFSRLVYNDNLSNNNQDFLFNSEIEGVGAINSLNLNRIYVLTTQNRTASASELLVNSLRPYINVVTIGESTVGKTQASILLFDSPGLTNLEDVDPTHTYAIQPLVANSINVNNVAVPADGIPADIALQELPFNLGTLGSVDEPLLAAAIQEITGSVGRFTLSEPIQFRTLSVEEFIDPVEQSMYID